MKNMKNIARKKFFRRLLGQSLSIAGVDLGPGFIKTAEISFAGKKPLLKAAGITGVPREMIKDGRIANLQALPTLLKKLWVDSALTCHDAAVAVDGRSVFARDASLPAMSRAELETALRWEIGKYVPYEENSYYYDFATIEGGAAPPGENTGECRVFLAAAPIKIVDDLAGALRQARLKVWAVDVEALAMAAGGDWEGVNVLADIGCFHSQIIVFDRDIPVLSRVIPWGGQKFTELIMEEFGLTFDEAEKYKLCQEESEIKLDSDAAGLWQKKARFARATEHLIAELSGEIRRSADYFLRNRQDGIKNVYLSGGGAKLKNLADGIAAGLDTVPVSIRNPLDGLEIAPGLAQSYLDKIAPQLTVAIGLALRCGEYWQPKTSKCRRGVLPL